jgi:threonine synthase
MQKLLATNGIWVEPASAAGVAGLAHELKQGKLDLKGKRVVAVCTGHGLKDPDIVTRDMPKPKILVAELRALEDYLAGGGQA